MCLYQYCEYAKVTQAFADATGMKFFPGYLTDARRLSLDAAAFRWNQTGQQQKKLMKWGDKSQLQGGMLMLEAPSPQAPAHRGRPPKQRPESLPTPDVTKLGRQSGTVALVKGMMSISKVCMVSVLDGT